MKVELMKAMHWLNIEVWLMTVMDVFTARFTDSNALQFFYC